MCGIAGVHGWVEDDVLGDMLCEIVHRGPDDEGRYVAPDAPLMMGSRRLSIIDIAGGEQPIYNEEETVAVVFNGEIYNHQQLRSSLEAKGHRFRTDCDTEVLVHLWEEYGEAMPEHLDGMFAFSLWDERSETLFLARDRLGIKPLYYAETDDAFVWGSELPSLLAAGVDRTVDERALYNYFYLQYTPNPQTLVSSIRKVPPGTAVRVSDGEASMSRYWTLTPGQRSESRSSTAATVRDLLETAVEERLMADVPLGAFLSGGLDSSAVVGLMSQLRDTVQTFSVGFESASIDESREARFVADHFGTDHHQIDVDISSMDVFDQLVQHYGEPLADPASLPTMLLSQYASDSVKVVLTGEGADELFGGYYRYRQTPRHRRLLGNFPDGVYRTAMTASERAPVGTKPLEYFASLGSDEEMVLNSARRFRPEPDVCLETAHDPESSGLRGMIRETGARTNGDSVQRIASFDLSYWLSDNLLYKVDHATMAASLEARVPFLDHQLVEYVYGAPSAYKGTSQEYKPLLSEAVADVVPERTRQRDKQGFQVPIDEWFETDHEPIAKWLTEDRIDATPYLRSDRVFDLWQAHRSGAESNEHTLWKALNYVAWYHTVLEGTTGRGVAVNG